VNSTKHKQSNLNVAAVILLVFREGRATDMETLFRALGLAWPYRPSSLVEIPEKVVFSVEELIGIGLLQTDGPNFWTSTIRVTELLAKLQKALDLSLTFLASFDRRQIMAVEPLFGLPGTLAEGLDVFVLMPFKPDMLPVYEDSIKPTCASLNLTVERGDDFFTANAVVEDIWKAIVNAHLIVADCTDRNPNVFYEIGLAHTLGKETILITQREEDIPFDLRHLRYILYQFTPRGMKEFETKFKQTVQSVLSAE
jgi:hypothetical protein